MNSTAHRRNTFQALLLVMLLVSLGITVLSGQALLSQPTTQYFIDRTQEELKAKYETTLAKRVTTSTVEKRLTALLTDVPRNWFAIDAVFELAKSRNLPLSDDVIEDYEAANHQDRSFTKQVQRCGSCAINIEACDLSIIASCHAVSIFTPVGDIAGVTRETMNWATDEDVDEVELALSGVGLAATIATPFTFGTSYSIKVGASIAKVARKISLSSSEFRRLPASESKAAYRDIGDLRRSAGFTDSLYLMKYIDDSEDARRFSRLSRIDDKHLVGATEVIGKNRLLRMVVKYSDELVGVVAGITCSVLLALSFFWKSILSLVTTTIRRIIRRSILKPGLVKN